MAKNRRANAVMFGFDFQVNAAIVLMLENMEELILLRDNIYKNYDVIREKDKNILKDIKTVNKID